MSYITIQNIHKSFHNKTVLQSLNLTLEEGEFVTLLGPSGCGKSTLLRILAGLTAPDTGVIMMDGKEITNVKAKDRNVGMVFQSYALFPNMTVEENIAFGLKIQKANKEIIRQKVKRLIEMVGLEGKETSYPRELSGGQQQRVALARALIVEPKVLLLDEPLSALDAQIRKNLQKLLRHIQQELNMTTILVTHDQEEAMAMSDRIFLLNNGQIVQSGTPHSIYTQPKNEFAARFIGNYNILTGQQLHMLIEGEHFSPRKKYAIRPEAFSLNSMPGGFVTHGKVVDIQLLGNIARYELESGSLTYMADFLHQSNELDRINEEVTLYIHKGDVIELS
ncbi:ABC transporter ATP-binding protein [Bacillus sp. REN10]|uniref:ABC transporter ATP-binding protein n=1 Tax=Bacillus sp. REN10 TaxID=2782541 RepID=UPI00193C0236|nr:ABC transporter ATP-binding protein [Bacillus sp. REN10]